MNAKEYLKKRKGITYDMIDYTDVDMIEFAESYLQYRVNNTDFRVLLAQTEFMDFDKANEFIKQQLLKQQ